MEESGWVEGWMEESGWVDGWVEESGWVGRRMEGQMSWEKDGKNWTKCWKPWEGCVRKGGYMGREGYMERVYGRKRWWEEGGERYVNS